MWKFSNLNHIFRKIFAFDRDSNRTKTLSQIIESNNVKIAEVKNADFLKINMNDKCYEKVEYVIVDPPCSGSGIAKRGEFFDEFDEPDLKRIQSLANLQVIFLYLYHLVYLISNFLWLSLYQKYLPHINI